MKANFRWQMMRRSFGLMLAAAVDSVFPRTCRVCGCSLSVGEGLLCMGCLADLPRTGLHRLDFNTIHHRIGGTVPIRTAAGWFYYYSDSPYARLIREAKYDDRPSTARRLGEAYAAELADEGFAGGFDVLLPVPLHRDRLIRRGYNQSKKIAEGMASVWGCDVGDNLVAIRRHDTQTRRHGYERYENVCGSFALRHPEELEGLNVAVVDDVVTTGSTMLDCINAIAASAVPASVSVMTIGVAKMK